MKKITIIISILLLTYNLFAQRKAESGDESKFGIKIKGYAKTDVMYDSRQTVAVREGHLLLYPKAEHMDNAGKDCNAKANFNMLSVQTRVAGVISAPSFLGAKSSGYIEAAFFGHSDSDVNGLRLRHAFLKLSWEKSSLLVGQYWHPMFITDVFPGVVSFNTGMPFQPFSRNPQIRFTQKMAKVEIALSAVSQRDFTNTGPDGGSSVYLRNSAIPIFDLNIKYKSSDLVAGIGANVKSLTPRIITAQNFRTDNTITSFSGMAFAKIVKNALTVKLEGIYGNNLTDMIMLGGYAVSAVETGTGIEEYTNIKTASSWGEVIYGKTLKFGLFAGYTKNLGAEDNIIGAYYSRGSDVKNVMRIAPRMQYRFGSTQLAGEIEYTSAAYGTPNNKGEVEGTNTVGNLRVLVSTYIFF